MLFNPSWISAFIAIGTVVIHVFLWIVNRRVEARIQTLENRILGHIQETKDWTQSQLNDFVSERVCSARMAVGWRP